MVPSQIFAFYFGNNANVPNGFYKPQGLTLLGFDNFISCYSYSINENKYPDKTEVALTIQHEIIQAVTKLMF